MTPVCPNVPDDARFSAREACNLLGICFNTLKKYVETGKIVPGTHSDGTPFYFGKDIKALWRNV